MAGTETPDPAARLRPSSAEKKTPSSPRTRTSPSPVSALRLAVGLEVVSGAVATPLVLGVGVQEAADLCPLPVAESALGHQASRP